MNKENNNDLISRSELKNAILEHRDDYVEDNFFWTKLFDLIDNAPAVDLKDEIAGAYNEGYMCGNKEAEKARPQGECVEKYEKILQIVEHWNDKSSSFVSACEAFEKILDVTKGGAV